MYDAAKPERREGDSRGGPVDESDRSACSNERAVG